MDNVTHQQPNAFPHQQQFPRMPFHISNRIQECLSASAKNPRIIMPSINSNKIQKFLPTSTQQNP
jgi:hypothetical protein